MSTTHSAASARGSGGAARNERSHKRFLTKLTVISTLGGLLFGYDTGVISGALLYMKDELNLSAVGEATVVSSLLFPGAAVGALLGGRLSDALGRKRTLLVCAGLFLVGALGVRWPPTWRSWCWPGSSSVSVWAPPPSPARSTWPRWRRSSGAGGW